MLNFRMGTLLKKNSKIAVTSRSFSRNDKLIANLKTKFKHIKLNSKGYALKGKNLIDFLDGMDGAIIGIEPITSKVLSELPSLKHISKYGVGTNNLDMEAIKSHGISLSLSPGSNSQSVAEYALYLMLLSMRQNFNNMSEIAQNIWSQKKGRELFKKRVGIIGFGNIGKQLSRMLKPFQIKVMLFDSVKINLTKSQSSFIEQVQLSTLLRKADIISLHLPLTKGTENFITKNEFSIMKNDVVIVNTSRGGIVNERDLFTFLKKNPDAFGAFDVFKKEPNFSSKLYGLPNFFASSHRASLTNEGIDNMGMAAINGLLKK